MNDYLALLQGYYKFLLLGKFFENQTKNTEIKLNEDLQIKTGSHTKFSLKSSQISALLSEIHKHPDSKNVFGYLTEISAFRGIFSVMREMIEKLPTFRSKLQELFWDEYRNFEQVIRFLRNVLSHSTTPSLLVHLADFQQQRDFLSSQKIKKLNLHFVYADHIKQWEGSKTYACDVELDLFSLKPLTPLFNVVNLHQMYLLAELCFNVSKIITARPVKSSR